MARINFAGIVDGVSNGVTRSSRVSIGLHGTIISDNRPILTSRTAEYRCGGVSTISRELKTSNSRRFSRLRRIGRREILDAAWNKREGDGVCTYERGRVERFESTPLNSQRAQHASRARSGRPSTRKIDKVRELWRCLGLTDNNGSN